MKITRIIVPVSFGLVIVAYILFQLGMFDKYKKVTVDHDPEYAEEEKKAEERVVKFPEKEKLLIKIIDAVDHIQTIEGSYETYQKEPYQTSIVTYAYDKAKQFSMYKIINKGNSDNADYVVIGDINNGTRTIFDEIQRTYEEFELIRSKEILEYETLPARERAEVGNPNTPGIHSLALNFREVPMWLSEYENWEFEKDTYLDLPAYKVTGTITPQMSTDMQGQFELWIHEETGVLLEFKLYDDNHEEKYSYVTKEIHIDEEIAPAVFQKNLSQYKKIENDY